MTENSPERAAAVLPGDVLATEISPDEQMAVVVKRGAVLPHYVLCSRAPDGWSAVDWDDDEPPDAAPREATHGWHPRITWTSTASDAELAAGSPNAGMEFARGLAPPGARRAVLRAGDERIAVPVVSETYWPVRWNVADDDDEDDELLLDAFEDD